MASNGYRSTAAERRAKIAANTARLEAEARRQAGLTLEAYLAEIAADYGITHNSNVAAGEDLEWFTARHAELVARYGARS